MIIDNLDNYKLYTGLGERISRAFTNVLETDYASKMPGKYPIEADDIFAIVSEYKTKDKAKGKLEAHKKYIDLQYMARGTELMGYASIKSGNPLSTYDQEKDIIFYEGEASFIKFDHNMFAIFFPGDLHMPGIGSTPESVKKIVIKIKV